MREILKEIKLLTMQYRDNRISKCRMLKTLNHLADSALVDHDAREKKFQYAKAALEAWDAGCGNTFSPAGAMPIVRDYFNRKEIE